MTQEDKELLLKDLCARLPYGVKINNEIQGDFNIYGICENIVFGRNEVCHIDFDVEKIKPYLFPISSMTDEMMEELKAITDLKYDQNTLELVEWNEKLKTLEFWLEEIPQYKVIEVFDWLNKNHFDYRCLIERGLAIDATGLNIY